MGGDSHKPPLPLIHHAEGDGSEKTSKPVPPLSPRPEESGNPAATANAHSSSVSPLQGAVGAHESPKPADSHSSMAPAKQSSVPVKIKPEPAGESEASVHSQADKKPAKAKLPVPSDEQQQAAERRSGRFSRRNLPLPVRRKAGRGWRESWQRKGGSRATTRSHGMSFASWPHRNLSPPAVPTRP